MTHSKQTFVTAFALFSLFFGVGNLVLPPLLGYRAGDDWFWVAMGFTLSAVIIPIMAIYGHARLQGTMMDFGKKVSPAFALMYCIIVYAIAASLPSPRTASFTYEMSVQPYFEMSSLTLSSIYFILVLVFVLNRSKILNIIGKFLTPLIILILLIIIAIGLFADVEPLRKSVFENTFTSGILEGYQTFDAIGGIVVGGVIVISLALRGSYSYDEKKSIIAKSGLIAGLGLFLIYGGLIALGAANSGTLETDERTELLIMLSKGALGDMGTAFLAVLVALACFTTAVGIITGVADFVKGITGQSKLAYIIAAVVSCISGVLVGQFDLHYIIDVAVPVLMFIYPITIVLIVLNVLNQRWASKLVFRVVVAVTFIFSIPDFLGFFVSENALTPIKDIIPLSGVNMGWVIPAVIAFVLTNTYVLVRGKTELTH